MASKPHELTKPQNELILPADEIIDPHVLQTAIATDIAGVADLKSARAIAGRHLIAAKNAANFRLAEAFAIRPLDARALISAQSYLTDVLVTSALHAAQTHLHPLPNPTESERLAVLAVGGFGRAEMAPHSDVTCCS